MENKINSIFRIAGGAAKALNEGFKGTVKQLTEVNVDNVLSSLTEIAIKKTHYTTEKHVETLIVSKLDEEYGRVHRQYSIGGFLALKVDVDLFDGRIGIEIKLARELIESASCIERLFGQVLYYSRRKYKENLIVLIVGLKKEYNQVIREVEAICEEQGVRFYYLEVV